MQLYRAMVVASVAMEPLVRCVSCGCSRATPGPLENMAALSPGQPQDWANRGHLHRLRVG